MTHEDPPEPTPAERADEENWIERQYQHGTRIFLSNRPTHWNCMSPRAAQLAAERLRKKIIDRWPYVQVEITSLAATPIGPEALIEEIGHFVNEMTFPTLAEVLEEIEP